MCRWIPLLCLLCVTTPLSAATTSPKAAYTEPATQMEFVAIPGGTFTMGGSDEPLEEPRHEVTVKPFLLGKYEVTFAQYAVFCKATGRQLPGDNGWGTGSRPVINVTWDDAVSFTAWLSQKTGKRFRLPSEAEWEYAARGGANTRFPWGEELGKNRANCQECGSRWDNKMTAPVGSFAPNGYGIHDVIGNVYEWCLDIQHDSYKDAPADGTPWVTNGDGEMRVKRGGSFRQAAVEMTIVRRCWGGPGIAHDELGFRVLREP